MAFSLAFSPSVALAATDTSSIRISVPSVTGLPSQQISVPINISHSAQEIYGIDLWLSYNSSLLKVNDVNGVVAGSMTAGWSVVNNAGQAGLAMIGLYGSAALAGGTGSLAVINFMVKKAAPPGAKSSLRLKKADFNERPVKAVKDGKFTVLKK